MHPHDRNQDDADPGVQGVVGTLASRELGDEPDEQDQVEGDSNWSQAQEFHDVAKSAGFRSWSVTKL